MTKKKPEVPGSYMVEISTVDENQRSYNDHTYYIEDADGASDAIKKAEGKLRPSETVVKVRAVLLLQG